MEAESALKNHQFPVVIKIILKNSVLVTIKQHSNVPVAHQFLTFFRDYFLLA